MSFLSCVVPLTCRSSHVSFLSRVVPLTCRSSHVSFLSCVVPLTCRSSHVSFFSRVVPLTCCSCHCSAFAHVICTLYLTMYATMHRYHMTSACTTEKTVLHHRNLKIQAALNHQDMSPHPLYSYRIFFKLRHFLYLSPSHHAIPAPSPHNCHRCCTWSAQSAHVMYSLNIIVLLLCIHYFLFLFVVVIRKPTRLSRQSGTRRPQCSQAWAPSHPGRLEMQGKMLIRS